MQRCLAYAATAVVTILTLLRSATSFSQPANDPRGELTPQQVRAAIEKGVAYIKRSQNQNGTWPEYPQQPGGLTSLCTLALITAGVPLDDDALQRALTYLRTVSPETTYATSLQTMVFCAAEPKKDLLLIRRNVRWLEEEQNREGARKGSWPYSPVTRSGDGSNTQFAMLALYEAQRVGVPVSDRTWKLALQYWESSQGTDGSWNYLPSPSRDPNGTGSMTCAGISSVFISAGRLDTGDAEVVGGELKCCGGGDEDEAQRAIENGLAWMGNNFTVQSNPGSPMGWHLYYLYGMERVGRMTSRRFFERPDGRRFEWYRMGSEVLLAKQDQLSGYWKGDNHIESNAQIGTSLALMFLAKGRRPVLVSKAKFGPGDDWDHHRSDLANLTNYVELHWKHEFPLGLSWQVIDVAGASVDDLLQTPVLYLSGSQAPQLLDQAKKLREYIDRGGFLFAEACCSDNRGFDAGFRALMEKVFDEPEYRLKPVPPEHPLWSAEEPVNPSDRPNLWCVDYGCRTCVVYAAPSEQGDLPHCLSCYWEIASGRERKLSQALQQQLDAALSVGINVLAYATNRELKTKDENFRLPDQKTAEDDTFERGKRYVAKLRHPGGCDAAPGALPALLRAASRELKARFSTEQRQVAPTDPDLFNYDVLFMHGRHNFRFTDAERQRLKKYLERGTLIVDSICTNPEFAAAFRREIGEIFADQGLKLEAIPASHPMFTREFGGYDLSQVSRREPRAREADGPLKSRLRTGPPDMEGLKIGDRYAVIFSPYDLSCAMEKHDSLECEGYTREDALRIGLNLLLYATFEF